MTPENLNKMFHLLTNLFVCLLCCRCTHRMAIQLTQFHRYFNRNVNFFEKSKRKENFIHQLCLGIYTNKKNSDDFNRQMGEKLNSDKIEVVK